MTVAIGADQRRSGSNLLNQIVKAAAPVRLDEGETIRAWDDTGGFGCDNSHCLLLSGRT